MAVKKICIYPCGGIGLIVSCVTRLAGYLLEEEFLPGKVGLLSVPGLLRGRREDQDLVEENPTIVIDGCAHHCGSNFLVLIGIKPAARVYTPDIILDTGFQPGCCRQELEESGKELSREVALRASRIAKGILEDPHYLYQKQLLIPRMSILCDYSVDVERELGYLQIEPGIYRPREMPPLPGIEKEIEY